MTFIVFLISLALEAPPTTPYRILSGCDPAAQLRGEVARNTPLEIGFSIAGARACYSVTATVDGKPVHGYVLDLDLDAVREFEKARVAVEREAFSAAPPVPSTPAPAPSVGSPGVPDPRDSAKEESKPPKDPLKKTPKITF